MIIYKTTNLLTGKIYIGQKSKHKGKLIKSLNDLLQTDYYGSSKQLKADIKEFGAENFRRELLEEGIETKKELNAKETEWNLKYDATNTEIGYNISTMAYPFFIDCHHTDEAKQKISEANTGKGNKGKSTWNNGLTKETDNRIKEKAENSKGKNTWSKGRKLSEETKQKIRDKRALQSPLSEEARKKISESSKGHNLSEESKKKISEANKGKKLSIESIAKRTESRRKNYIVSEETKRKTSEKMKLYWENKREEQEDEIRF